MRRFILATAVLATIALAAAPAMAGHGYTYRRVHVPPRAVHHVRVPRHHACGPYCRHCHPGPVYYYRGGYPHRHRHGFYPGGFSFGLHGPYGGGFHFRF